MTQLATHKMVEPNPLSKQRLVSNARQPSPERSEKFEEKLDQTDGRKNTRETSDPKESSETLAQQNILRGGAENLIEEDVLAQFEDLMGPDVSETPRYKTDIQDQENNNPDEIALYMADTLSQKPITTEKNLLTEEVPTQVERKSSTPTTTHSHEQHSSHTEFLGENTPLDGGSGPQITKAAISYNAPSMETDHRIDPDISDYSPAIDVKGMTSIEEPPKATSADTKPQNLTPIKQVQIAVDKHVTDDGAQHFTLDLNPKELGKVKVEVTFDSRDNSRHISIRTETPEALQALKESADWLRLNLASDKTSTTTSFDFSQETEGEQPGFQASKRKSGGGHFDADHETTHITLPPQETNLHLLHEVV